MSSNDLNQLFPPLTPKISDWMRDVSRNQPLLRNLFEQYGSPVNLHYLEPFGANYEDYKAVLDRYQLNYKVFFARKANTCRAFPVEAHRLGFGVDTASYRELEQCLQLGCSPENLIATAAVKNEDLLRLALNNDVLMIMDNTDECRIVNRLAEKMGKTPKIGIRISGFTCAEQKLYSRFGFDVEEVGRFIAHRLGPGGTFPNLRFAGFHFHLDGYAIDQRGEALVQTIELADRLQNDGIKTSFIDMGGGLLTNYLLNKTEWDTFWQELKKAVRGKRLPITFGNTGLGYKIVRDKMHGAPDVYPYYNETSKSLFLDSVLSYRNDNGIEAASLLRERDIEFRMEPGRSLLDQTGMTIAGVAHRKKDQRGDWLVGLNMNRSQLYSSSADFLLDPMFIPMQSDDVKTKPVAVYLTGAYCLEQDIILKRKIVLPHLPEAGDVIAFPNTAGYMMHFYETRSHLFNFSTNIVADSDSFPNFLPDDSMN